MQRRSITGSTGAGAMSAEEPMCRIVEYALNSLVDMIHVGEVGMASDVMQLRRSYFSILHNVPVTCRAARDEAKLHVAFEYMLFYERVRLGVASSHFFLDGVPSGVHLFVGPTSLVLPHDDIRKLKLRDVVADRLQVVGKMESMPPDAERKVSLTTQHTAGLPVGVPGPVRFLVARSRAIFQGLRATKSPDSFAHCANCNCNRFFYHGGTAESWANAAVSSVALGGDEEEEHDSAEYWKQTAGSPLDVVSDVRRFCSQACARQHAHHLQILMPDANLHLDADDYAKKSGRARVVESFKLALKRNEVAARALRTMRTTHFPSVAVSTDEIEMHRQKRIRALNIDLGLLYAASMIAESASMSNGRILPGQRMYWRDDPMYYSKALSAVSRIYENLARKEGIVSSILTMPKYMTKLQTVAHKLF